MTDNPWVGLEDTGYDLQDIGRPAVFLVPSHLLTHDARAHLEQYLVRTFGGFQRADALVSGVYTTDAGQVQLDRCVQYEVSFLGKERISDLARVLADMARGREECIYLKAGQYTALLRPTCVP